MEKSAAAFIFYKVLEYGSIVRCKRELIEIFVIVLEREMVSIAAPAKEMWVPCYLKRLRRK